MSEYNVDGKYIRFEFLKDSPSGKTRMWQVVAKEGGSHLGIVKWFGRWRRYAFFPHPECVFEETCMREIANFIVDETRKRRQARKK